MEFTEHYSRCIVMFGVPYHTAVSRNLKARLAFLSANNELSENEYLNYDAMKHTNQCVGRIITSKHDYGMVILADKRFLKPEKKSNMSLLIQNHLSESSENLSVDKGILSATDFFKEMGQPFKVPDKWNLDQKLIDERIQKSIPKPI